MTVLLVMCVPVLLALFPMWMDRLERKVLPQPPSEELSLEALNPSP